MQYDVNIRNILPSYVPVQSIERRAHRIARRCGMNNHVDLCMRVCSAREYWDRWETIHTILHAQISKHLWWNTKAESMTTIMSHLSVVWLEVTTCEWFSVWFKSWRVRTLFLLQDRLGKRQNDCNFLFFDFYFGDKIFRLVCLSFRESPNGIMTFEHFRDY